MRRENVHFCALSRVAPQDYSIPVPANCLQGQDFCFLLRKEEIKCSSTQNIGVSTPKTKLIDRQKILY